MKLLNTNLKNKVLQSMMTIIDKERNNILKANQKDLDAFGKSDQALYDRLVVDDSKIDGMIKAISEVKAQHDFMRSRGIGLHIGEGEVIAVAKPEFAAQLHFQQRHKTVTRAVAASYPNRLRKQHV